MYGYGMPNNVMMNSIDKQIENQENRLNELKQMRNQFNQPPSINQTFQLANNQSGMKLVDSIDDVTKEQIFNDTPFFSKDMSVLWIKNIKGEIKAYSLEEIIQKDEKDIEIEYLKTEIEKLKKGRLNEKCSSNNDIEPIKEQRSTSIPNNSKSK